MKKIRKFFLVLLISFCSIFGLVSIYLYHNQDEFIQKVISAANEQLNVEIQVQKIALNWYQDFPNISIICEGVKVGESLHKSKASLAELKSITLSFDFISLLKGDYVLDRLKLVDGFTHIKITESGDRNYLIVKKSSEEDKSAEELNFKIQDIILHNVQVDYEDRRSEQHYSLYGNDLKAALDKDPEKYIIKAKGSLSSKFILIKGMSYFKNKALSIDALLHYNEDKESILIEPSKLFVNNDQYEIKGSFNQSNDNIDLKIKGIEASITTIASLLPNEYESYIKDYKASGDAMFDASISGKFNSQVNPLVEINFKIHEALLVDPEYNTQIDSLNLIGKFTNGYSHSLYSSKLSIDQAEASIMGEHIRAKFELTNFNAPNLKLQATGSIASYDLFSFFPEKESFSQLKGMISFNIKLDGAIKDFKSAKTAYRINNSGELNLSEVGGTYSGYPLPFSNISGKLLFNKNDIAVNSLSGKIGESDIKMNGFFLNIIPYLLTDNQSILIEAETKSKFIDLNELLSGLSNKSTSIEKQQASYSFSLSPYLQIDIKSDIDKLLFQRFSGKAIKGDILVSQQQLRARELSVTTMGGKINLSGSINTAPKDIIDIHTTAHFKGLNVDSVFYTFYDFNQTFLTKEHLRGRIDADVMTHIELDKSLNFKPEAFESSIAASIKDGELINFEPMQSLSKYVREEDLANLKFGELSNSIKIKDQTIYLPEMTIRSNISEIKIQGTHTFTQEIDYRLLVPLKNYKRIDKDAEFGAIEETDDYTKLHLKITGTTDDFDVSWDGKRSLSSVGDKIKEEVKSIKQIFKGDPQEKEKKQLEVKEDEYFDW